MRKLFIASILVVASCTVMFAQINENPPCPTISLKTSADIIQPGETIVFTASIENKDLEKFDYDWTTFAGTIIEGQGTSVIKVVTYLDMSGSTITATVEVKGLQANCINKFSRQAELLPSVCCKDPIILDEYRKLSFRKEKARLDELASELVRDKDSTATFIFYYTEKNTPQTLMNRISRISHYLTQTHKIPKDRFNLVLGGTSRNRTRIYLVRKN